MFQNKTQLFGQIVNKHGKDWRQADLNPLMKLLAPKNPENGGIDSVCNPTSEDIFEWERIDSKGSWFDKTRDTLKISQLS